MRRDPDFYQTGINYYVPKMTGAADVEFGKEYRVNIGTPSVADPDGVHADIDADGDAATILASALVPGTGGLGAESDATYGRNITAVASGATGGDFTLTAYGFDYLGQPMMETIVVANGDGTTPQVGEKAFKSLTKIVHDAGAANAVTVDVGWGAKFGLPYKTISVEAEYADRVKAGTTGTLTAPDETDPATATTNDPRGTVTPNTTPDGAKVLEFDTEVSDWINSDGNGGLHGIRHYFA